MPKIENTIEVNASPETVWSIVADPTYITKLTPDILSFTVEPPGLTTVGQKGHGIFKVAGRRTEFFTEVVEVEPNRKSVVKNRPGGLLKTFISTGTLEPMKRGTRFINTTEYELSMGYLGKVLNTLVVARAIRRNINVSLKNLKEIAELKEMPKTT